MNELNSVDKGNYLVLAQRGEGDNWHSQHIAESLEGARDYKRTIEKLDKYYNMTITIIFEK